MLLKTHMKKANCACTYWKLWASLLISHFLWYSWKLAWPVAFACSTASCITPQKNQKIIYFFFCHFKCHLKRRTTPISQPAWIMVLHHFSIIFDPKAGVTRSRGHPRTTASFFRRWTPSTEVIYLPQGQASRFPHGSLKISNSPRYPHYECGYRKLSAGKVTHPRFYDLTSEFSWDLG